MRTYLPFPLQFVLILICCPKLPATLRLLPLPASLSPVIQSQIHSISQCVRLSRCHCVCLALSVSHCVNTLNAAGKRCVTHTRTHTLPTYVAGSHVYCWQFFALLVRLPPRCPALTRPFANLWLLCQHRQFLCCAHSISHATPTNLARVWAWVAFVILEFKIQFTCVINLIASALVSWFAFVKSSVAYIILIWSTDWAQLAGKSTVNWRIVGTQLGERFLLILHA